MNIIQFKVIIRVLFVPTRVYHIITVINNWHSYNK